MAEPEDLTGREFNFLKVISRAKDRETPSGQKRKFWLCECLLCGTQKEIGAGDLKSGKTKSCGCYQPRMRKEQRNKKICVECGKEFECPASSKKITCSAACRSAHASKNHSGRKMSDAACKKISVAARERDMSEIQSAGTEAAKESPKSGRFETNVSAKDWHLISPEGKHYHFHSLKFWLRENGEQLFGCKPDSQEFMNVCSGLYNAKRAMLGGAYGCCTYKGWQVMPTEEDYKQN